MDDSGAITGFAGVTIDITSLREVEEDQRRSYREARSHFTELRELYDGAPVGLALLDHELRFVRVNAFLAWMNGIAAADHLGRSIFEVWPELRSHERLVRQVPATRKPVRDIDVEAAAARDPTRKTAFRFHCYPLGGEQGMTGIGLVAEEITAQKHAERAQELLRNELNHRIKNLFSAVSSIVTLSAHGNDDLAAFGHMVRGRIQALAKAHDLAQRDQDGPTPASGVPSLQALLRTLLDPYRSVLNPQENIRITGDDIALGAHATTGFALAFHELATNAAKYGALSSGNGQLSLTCVLSENRVAITWRERGGPPVAAAPKSHGFGSVLARRILVQDLGGAMQADWSPAGLILHVTLPQEALAR